MHHFSLFSSDIKYILTFFTFIRVRKFKKSKKKDTIFWTLKALNSYLDRKVHINRTLTQNAGFANYVINHHLSIICPSSSTLCDFSSYPLFIRLVYSFNTAICNLSAFSCRARTEKLLSESTIRRVKWKIRTLKKHKIWRMHVDNCYSNTERWDLLPSLLVAFKPLV